MLHIFLHARVCASLHAALAKNVRDPADHTATKNRPPSFRSADIRSHQHRASSPLNMIMAMPKRIPAIHQWPGHVAAYDALGE